MTTPWQIFRRTRGLKLSSFLQWASATARWLWRSFLLREHGAQGGTPTVTRLIDERSVAGAIVTVAEVQSGPPTEPSQRPIPISQFEGWRALAPLAEAAQRGAVLCARVEQEGSSPTRLLILVRPGGRPEE